MNINDGDELHGILHSAHQSSFGETKSKSKSNCNYSRIIRILAFFGVFHLAKGFIPSTNPVLTQRLIVESRDGFVPKFGADTSSNFRCFTFNLQASHGAQVSCGTTISREPVSQIEEHNDSRAGQNVSHERHNVSPIATQNPDFLAGQNDPSAGKYSKPRYFCRIARS